MYVRHLSLRRCSENIGSSLPLVVIPPVSWFLFDCQPSFPVLACNSFFPLILILHSPLLQKFYILFPGILLSVLHFKQPHYSQIPFFFWCVDFRLSAAAHPASSPHRWLSDFSWGGSWPLSSPGSPLKVGGHPSPPGPCQPHSAVLVTWQ